MGPSFFIASHWPWPRRKPCQRRQLRAYAVGRGIGDELMCSAVLREVKRRNPKCEITFVSRHPALLDGNPHIDRLEKFVAGETDYGEWMGYDHVRPPPRPLIAMTAESVGLLWDTRQLDPPLLADVSEKFRRDIAGIPEPWIVIQPMASRWTVAKQWPYERWRELVRQLTEKYSVIEIGTETFLDPAEFGPGFHSFIGKTSLQEMGTIVSRAKVFVAPPSGGMHLANAFRVPSVIIFGGYEKPEGYNYPRTAAFYRQVECAPCWLHEKPCPYDMKCMKQIDVGPVFNAIVKQLEQPGLPPEIAERGTAGELGDAENARFVPNLVSIIIPTYNRAHMIQEAVQSALNQSYPHKEIIVVDDGSTDGTEELLRNHPGIRYLRQDNAGPSSARNSGMRHARGEFLAFLDSDDLWEHNFLHECIQGLTTTGAGFVFANWRTIQKDGDPITLNAFNDCRELMARLGTAASDWNELNPSVARDLFIPRSLVTPSGMVLRHEYFTHRWDTRSRIGEDRQFIIEGLFNHEFPVACTRRVLWTYRVHDSNLCTQNPDRITVSAGEVYFKETLLARHSDHFTHRQRRMLESSLAGSYFDLGYHENENGNPARGIESLKKSWRLRKSWKAGLAMLRAKLFRQHS